MRRSHSTHLRGRLTLLMLLALLAAALPGARPVALAEPAAQTPPEGPAAPATPVIGLPVGPVAAQEVVEKEPGQGPKSAGLTQAEAVAINFGAAPVTVQQSLSDACAPMISNSPIFGNTAPDGSVNIYDWSVYQRRVYYRSDFYYSPPYALSMEDGDELLPPGTRDEDWFGQDFVFPVEGRSVQIEFNIRYSSPSTYPGGRSYGLDLVDYAYYELYRVDIEGDLIDENPLTQIMDPVFYARLDPPTVGESGYDPSDPFELDTWYRFRLYVNDSAADFTKLRGQRVALVFDQDGDKLAPFEEPIIDNPQVTVCPTPERPTNYIDDFVERNGETGRAITTATMVLAYSRDGVDLEVARVAYPTESGYYRFNSLPDLPEGGYYQVWYLKSDTEDDPETSADDRLAYYAGPRITRDMFAPRPGTTDLYADGGNFDILDVSLAAPINYAEVAGSASFSWTPSVISEASYSLCFFDPETFEEACEKPTTATSLTVSVAALAASWPAFDYERYLGWYVRILGPDFEPTAFADIGASGYSSFVKFQAEAVTVPEGPPAEAAEPPPAEGEKTWTLMFYMAGDDEDLTSPPGFARSMQDMVPALIGLADRFPSVNIVAQFDFFETEQAPLDDEVRGTQLCYFKPGVRNLATLCQQLGEQNTADPSTLATFINTALDRYPAPNTALIMLGHGSPVAGVAGDRTGDSEGRDDAMDPGELNAALSAAGLNGARDKLKALVYYNCLMGSYEVAALTAQYAEYMVASPNIATLVDINRTIIALAEANPNNPRAFATGIVDAYAAAMGAFNADYGQNISIAMAAYDLGKLPAVSVAVEGLAEALTNDLSRQEVRDARDNVQQYDSSAPVLWGFNQAREDALIDLGHLAAQLAANGESSSAIRTAAQGVLSALGTAGGADAFVASTVAVAGQADQRAGGTHAFIAGATTGLSIYFPNGSSEGNQAALTRMYFREYQQLDAVSLAWVELVDATRTGLPSLPRSIRLGGLAGGAPGSTLQNLGTPELFPPVASMPGSSALYLPMLRR